MLGQFGQGFWQPMLQRLQAQRGQPGMHGGMPQGQPGMQGQGGFRMPFGQAQPMQRPQLPMQVDRMQQARAAGPGIQGPSPESMQQNAAAMNQQQNANAMAQQQDLEAMKQRGY